LSAEGRLSDEEAAAKRLKENKRRGLLLKDMDALAAMDESFARLCCTVKKDGTLSGDVADHKQLSQLREYVMTVLGNMVTDIASGNVSADPYTRGASHDACAFCPYGSICRETADAGRRNYQKMDADRFWSEIGKEAGNG
jgi:ATP-dependent helicase/nuclease subunit B